MKVLISHKISDIKSFSGIIVIIDVLRAATSMCCLFNQGAKEIKLMESKKDALIYNVKHPEELILGEERGCKIDGFDLGNSPEQILKRNLNDYNVAMITTNCTRGVFAAKKAKSIYCAGFVNLGTTAKSLINYNSEQILIIPIGNLTRRCPADDACADYLRGYLLGETLEFSDIKNNIVNSSESKKYFDPSNSKFTTQDLMISLSINKFPFELKVKKTDRLMSIERE